MIELTDMQEALYSVLNAADRVKFSDAVFLHSNAPKIGRNDTPALYKLYSIIRAQNAAEIKAKRHKSDINRGNVKRRWDKSRIKGDTTVYDRMKNEAKTQENALNDDNANCVDTTVYDRIPSYTTVYDRMKNEAKTQENALNDDNANCVDTTVYDRIPSYTTVYDRMKNEAKTQKNALNDDFALCAPSIAGARAESIIYNNINNINNNLKNNIINNTQGDSKGGQDTPELLKNCGQSAPIYEFSFFWNDYGKKIDRKRCEKKFNSLSNEAKEKIREAVKLYVANTPEEKFRKNPLTWLNGECWNDEYSLKTQRGAGKNGGACKYF